MKPSRLYRFRQERPDVKVALDVASLGEIIVWQASNKSSLMRELDKDWEMISLDVENQNNQLLVILNDELTKSFFAARSVNIDRFGLLSSAVERINNRKTKFSTHAQGSIFSKSYLETLSEDFEW